MDKTGRAVLWFAAGTAHGALEILPWVEVFLRQQNRYLIRRCQRIENATRSSQRGSDLRCAAIGGLCYGGLDVSIATG